MILSLCSIYVGLDISWTFKVLLCILGLLLYPDLLIFTDDCYIFVQQTKTTIFALHLLYNHISITSLN